VSMRAVHFRTPSSTVLLQSRASTDRSLARPDPLHLLWNVTLFASGYPVPHGKYLWSRGLICDSGGAP